MSAEGAYCSYFYSASIDPDRATLPACGSRPNAREISEFGQEIQFYLPLLRHPAYRPRPQIEVWAGKQDGVVKEGKIEFPDQTPIFLVHWAGFHKLEELPYQDLWMHYRNMNNKLPPLTLDKPAEGR